MNKETVLLIVFALLWGASFGAFFGGVYYVSTKAGYNVVGSGTVAWGYIMKEPDGSYMLSQGGKGVPFSTNVPLQLETGKCYLMYLSASAFPPSGHLDASIVATSLCSPQNP